MFNWKQISIGIIALLIGTVVYFIDRPADDVYFVKKLGVPTYLFDDCPFTFGVVGKGLPSFAHVFAFTLITAGLVAREKKGYIIVSLVWFFIDAGFELGQRYSDVAMSLVPYWFKGIPFFEHTRSYFRYGTFDWLDMAMIGLGSLSAFTALILTRPSTRYKERVSRNNTGSSDQSDNHLD